MRHGSVCPFCPDRRNTCTPATIAFANDTTFSLLHLDETYAEATTDTARLALVTAGDTLLAVDSWHGLTGYIAGFFMREAGVLISLLMLKRHQFGRVMAVAGSWRTGST